MVTAGTHARAIVWPVAIDKESRVPFFRQLADIFRGKIDSGEWPPDRRIPTEAQLAAQYDVNRETVRNAIRVLSEDGWLEAVQGKGTFVIPEAERRPPQ